MSNACIAYSNLADSGTVSSDTAASDMPVSRVQNEHVSKKWRGVGTSAWLLLDRGSDLTMDTFSLHGVNSSVTSIRVRASTSAGGPTSGALHDVTYTSANAEYDPNYGSLVVAKSAAVVGRYLRFDFVASTMVEVGRLGAWTREEFAYNYTPGQGITWVDRSRKTKSAGGQTIIDRDNKYRIFDLSFDLITEAQREGVVENVERVNGQSKDVLFILDTASDKLPRDSVFGLIVSPSPILQSAFAGVFGKTYQVEERL